MASEFWLGVVQTAIGSAVGWTCHGLVPVSFEQYLL